VAKKTRNAKAGNKSQQQQPSHRKVIVFAALLAAMTATSALLLALAPAPLTPGAVNSLFAVGTPDSLDPIFQTSAPIEPGRWKYIYIHHSKTVAGSAATIGESADALADHFVIGNGDGCGDGEVQIAQRWHHQRSAGQVDRRYSIDKACVSICLVGDFNRALPTSTQLRRVAQLVTAIQERCDIPADKVLIVEREQSMAGVGRYFPTAKLREQLLP
jgi:hypothetical protein